jgi:hypothetical protein
VVGPDAKLFAVGEVHINQAWTCHLQEVNYGRRRLRSVPGKRIARLAIRTRGCGNTLSNRSIDLLGLAGMGASLILCRDSASSRSLFGGRGQ